MSLFLVASAAHLGGSVVLALFFLLLAAHEPRAYLRDWTAAWIAQAVALAFFLGVSWLGWPWSLSLYLFLATAHGLLLVSAAWTFAHGTPSWTGRLGVLGAVLAWSWLAPGLLPERHVDAAQLVLLSAASVTAGLVLWQAREPGAMGVRLSTYVFVLLGAVQLLEAAALGGGRAEPAELFVATSPLLLLFLQMMLGLSLVLGVMERTQRSLSAANGRLEEAQHQLQVLADTDPLTGCANRRVFRELVDRLRAGEVASRGAVLLIDMDGLKAINDRDGHAAGDDAIRRLAHALRSRTRLTDVVVRWGGDEFVVALPGATMADARARSDGIAQAIEAEGLRASIGCGVWGDGVDVMAAVQLADEQMYRAKSARKKIAAAARA